MRTAASQIAGAIAANGAHIRQSRPGLGFQVRSHEERR